MAGAIACWVRDTAIISNTYDVEYKKAMIGSIMTSKVSFDTKIKGMHGYKKTNKSDRINNSSTLNITNLPFFIK